MPLFQLPASEAWIDDAPCGGQWPLFDPLPLLSPNQRLRNDTFIVASLPALEMCRSCPFTQQCLDRVDPQASYFDGVAAGRVWRNGKAVHSIRRAA